MVNEAREQLAMIENKRAGAIAVFKASEQRMQRAHEEASAADDRYQEAIADARKAREQLSQIEAEAVTLFKAIMQAERQ
jgi:hypothetical protein